MVLAGSARCALLYRLTLPCSRAKSRAAEERDNNWGQSKINSNLGMKIQ
jgi:hypothetical protein